VDAEIAVVGLGAMGSMALWRLAQRGVRVDGYERFGIAHDRGASAGQTRRFSALTQKELRFTPLAIDALHLWRSLQSITGRTLIEQVGGIIVGPADAPALTLAAQSAATTNLAHELVDARDLARRFPQHLIRPTDAGIIEPTGGFVRPELAVLSAVRQAESLGATVHDHTRVLTVEPDSDGVLVRTDAGTRRYAQAVVAPGPWAREVLGATRDLVLPRRLVQAWYAPIDITLYRADVFPVFERVGDVKAYGFPTVDGATVKVGIYTAGHPIVYDLDQPPRTVSLALARYFRDTVATFLPGLHPDPVTIATGIEGYTTDGLPLLGTLPATPQVIMACGFSGSGFKFAPVIGDTIADLAIDGTTERDIDFLSPSRPLAAWPADHRTLA